MTLTNSRSTSRTAPEPERATRTRPPGWRNPRLVVGLLLVAGSVVLGARLLASADDTVGVWVLSRDLPAGALLEEGALESQRVRFPDAATADLYLATTDRPPRGATLDRPLAAGELLPRAAFAGDGGADLVEVPISVGSDDLPATVRQGSAVDVWVTPEVPAVHESKVVAVPVLTDVVVVAVPGAADSLAPQATRQVIVGVPEERAEELASALGGISAGRVIIARKG